MVPEFVARTRGSKWVQALPTLVKFCGAVDRGRGARV